MKNIVSYTRPELETFSGCNVVDQQDDKFGTFDGLWIDPSTQHPEFLGVKVGVLLLARTHVVPSRGVVIDEENDLLRVPYPAELVKQAPSFTPGQELSSVDKEEIGLHYGSSVTAERVTSIDEVRPEKSAEAQTESELFPETNQPALIPPTEHTAVELGLPSRELREERNLTAPEFDHTGEKTAEDR